MDREDNLKRKVDDLESIINELEDKNGKLVELLNENIYQKAETYKNKVLNRLQKPAHTPNKTSGLAPYNTQQIPKQHEYQIEQSGHNQDSPSRLKRIIEQEHD